VIGTYSSIFIAAPVLIYLGARSVTMAEDKAAAPVDAAPAKR
jgi:preprotein translocase subunit SecF